MLATITAKSKSIAGRSWSSSRSSSTRLSGESGTQFGAGLDAAANANGGFEGLFGDVDANHSA
ncbi:hypothetical protein ACW73L_17625 [Methylolobus aquaticus]